MLLIIIIGALSSVTSYGVDKSLWVGEVYTWDFSGSVFGSTRNMKVWTDGANLNVSGSGFSRKISARRYFSGTETVVAEWDYSLYYGGPTTHSRVELKVGCNENPVSISPKTLTMNVGDTYWLGYTHQYNANPYVGNAQVSFSGGGTSASVSYQGLVTATAPGVAYARVHSNLSGDNDQALCEITVLEVQPTGATTQNYQLLADQSIDLTVSVSPSNATIHSKKWYVKSGSDIVSISGSSLTGLWPGTAEIYCMINDKIRSNDATVVVSKPKLNTSSCSPETGSTGNSVFVTPSVTYSHTLSIGENFGSISLKCGGNSIEGEASISGRTVQFHSSHPLKPFTEYTFSVPRDAIKNKWGSPAQNDVTVSFTTGDLLTAQISFLPVSGSFLTRSDCVTISSVPWDANIYYTIDGSNPTTSSPLYTGPFNIDGDIVVKALAVREGYKDSEISVAEFFKSQSEIIDYYPSPDDSIFNYLSVSPHIVLSGIMEQSNNFRRIALTDSEGKEVEGKAFLTGNMIVYVPDAPLHNAAVYKMDIPYDAVKTSNGEIFRGFNWSFTTPTIATKVGMRGDESVFVLSEDGVLKTRGMKYTGYDFAQGSIPYENLDNLEEIVSDVDLFATGYHHYWTYDHGLLSGHGMAFCGEWSGFKDMIAQVTCKTVKAGFQTTAVITNDGSLWMNGRNDFCQQFEGTDSTRKELIKVAENVIDVALGNSFSLYVDVDHNLWSVGRNHKGQLGDGTFVDRRNPVKIMDGVEKVYASASGYFAACIKEDGSLLTWGDNFCGQLGREAKECSNTPELVINNAVNAALGENHMLAIDGEDKLFAWGSNRYGQIATNEISQSKPTLMAEDIADVAAGPNSTLILGLDGKVTGWGRKTNNNFGGDEGKAHGFVVCDGLTRSPLENVMVFPTRMEAKPNSEFALVAYQLPMTADYASVEWSSDNPEIASVDGNGKIITGQLGETIVRVKFTDRLGRSKEGTATVVSTENPNTAIDVLNPDRCVWNAYGQEGKVIVEGAVIGDTYMLYNLQGMILATQKANSDKILFDGLPTGAYLVRSGIRTVKVICK